LIIALAVLALLATYVWWTETHPDDEELTGLEEHEQELFPGADQEDVQALRIASGDVEVSLRRDGETWVIAGDSPRPADGDLAEAAARAVVGLVSSRRLPPGDDSAFGFGPGSLTVTFERADVPPVTFVVGSSTPVGAGVYLAIEGGDVVHVVQPWSLTPLQRDPLEYRDRSLFRPDAGELVRLEMHTADGALAMTRDGRHWFIDGEPPWRVETSKITEFVLGLSELTAASFLEEQPEVGDDWVSLTLADGTGAAATVHLSPPTPGGVRTALATGPLSASVAATVETDLVGSMNPSPEAWRAMELLDFNPWLVEGITWSAGGTTWTLAKTDATWTREGEDEPLDGDLVHDLLSELDDLRVAAYAPPGLDPAEAGVETASIELRQSDELTVGLTLFSGATRDYARLQGEPGLREVGADVGQTIGSLRPLTPSRDAE